MSTNYFQGGFINVVYALVNSCLILLQQATVYTSYKVFLPFTLIVLLIRTQDFFTCGFVSYFYIRIINATPNNEYLKCKIKI